MEVAKYFAYIHAIYNENVVSVRKCEQVIQVYSYIHILKIYENINIIFLSNKCIK